WPAETDSKSEKEVLKFYRLNLLLYLSTLANSMQKFKGFAQMMFGGQKFNFFLSSFLPLRTRQRGSIF
ncbi:MAG TPA: hypothetical protein VFX48_04665, partial [Saprospiraceae bacterium]|nr:hypothetical protein [Saprospiraceae bacterium]